MTTPNYEQVLPRVVELLSLTDRMPGATDPTSPYYQTTVLRALANGCEQIYPEAQAMMEELGLFADGAIRPAVVTAMPEILKALGYTNPEPFTCNVTTCPRSFSSIS